MRTDRPNLDRARSFTRRVGPLAIGVGLVMSLLSLPVLGTALAAAQPLALGVVLVLFGWAAYARTERTQGRIAQWGVTLVFCAGGAWSLMQWMPVLWGPHGGDMGGNIMLLAVWLTMGPALFVPGLLAAVRPGWTPLIVIPAILSLSIAAAFGYGIVAVRGLPGVESLTTTEQIVASSFSAANAAFLIIAARRAGAEWRS
ncbi:MAG: hypothetical protein FGM32_07310 [Candidatus Kapabacteria bacterium]|nr:hypothetical protein [Candidatus Kapabacteria bacterium]